MGDNWPISEGPVLQAINQSQNTQITREKRRWLRSELVTSRWAQLRDDVLIVGY